jgi:hypothetical protein
MFDTKPPYIGGFLCVNVKVEAIFYVILHF